MSRVASRRLLPPRPRFRDWPLAGATAAGFLALTELTFAAAGGSVLPPPIAMALIGSEVLVATSAALLLGLFLRLRGVPLSHPRLACAVAALLPALAVTTPVLGAPGAAGAGAILVGLALAAGIALLGARLLERAERSGVPVSGPWLWFGTAVLVASSERIAHAPGALEDPAAWRALAAAVALAAALGALAYARARRRGIAPPLPLARVLSLTGCVALAGSSAPAVLPWLLADPSSGRLDAGPPNVLLVAAPAAGGVAAELGRFGGVRIASLDTGRRTDLLGLLQLADGSPLVQRFDARGYATALIAADPDLVEGIAAEYRDAKPGAERILAERMHWIAGTPLLLGRGGVLFDRLGHGARRSPDRLAQAASHWLAHWRANRAPAPFFLVVDFRGSPSPPGRREAVAQALLRLLEQLEATGALERTIVAAAAFDGPGPGLELALRPPPGGRIPRGGDFATALLHGVAGS